MDSDEIFKMDATQQISQLKCNWLNKFVFLCKVRPAIFVTGSLITIKKDEKKFCKNFKFFL